MENIIWPKGQDFKTTKEKIEVISLLEGMKNNNPDMEFKDYCDLCLDAVRNNQLLKYDEIRDFIGMNNDVIKRVVSDEVRHILEMFNHISISLSKLPWQTAELLHSNYYTRFSGFENSAEQHLSYYIFLYRHRIHGQQIFTETLPLTLNHYRDMLNKYEKYKLRKLLTEEMLTYICIGRHHQIKFTF